MPISDNVIALDSRRRVNLAFTGEVAATGARPFLGTCSDGNQYWCKVLNSPHGREATINEVAASFIGQRIGAHMRPWEIIYIPEDLQGEWVGAGTYRYRLEATPVFGSLNLHTARLFRPENRIEYVEDDTNHIHVPKPIALWILCNVQDDIQVLADAADDNSLWSIDHGFWFDSLERPWQFTDITHAGGRPKIPTINGNIPASSWSKARAALSNLDDTLYDSLYELFPHEWAVTREESDKLVRYVLDRKTYTDETLMTFQQQASRR